MFLTVRLMLLGAAGMAMSVATPAETIAEAIPARAVVEFMKNGSTDAIIDLTSDLPGSQGNGLVIVFQTGATAGITGSPDTGYTVTFDIRIFPYDEVALFLDYLPDVTAVLRSPVASVGYEPGVVSLPPIVVLTGGVDAVVPEPSSAVLILTLVGASTISRWRAA